MFVDQKTMLRQKHCHLQTDLQIKPIPFKIPADIFAENSQANTRSKIAKIILKGEQSWTKSVSDFKTAWKATG